MTDSVTKPAGNGQSERLFLLFLVVVTIFMTLKYFPGLEHTDAYAGNTLSAIDPTAFPNDPFIDPSRPFWKRVFQISLIYLPAHLMGDIWLDDRFVVIVYFGLILATLIAVDKIVKLCGIKELMPRMLIQILFMRDHQYLTLTATFANQPDINHAAYVIPATAWLLYATFARKSLWVILFFCFLTAASSIKMAPYVIGFCLIIAAINGTRRDRLVVTALIALAGAVFVYVATVKFHLSPADRLFVWDWMYNDVEKWDSNPFYPFPATNVWARNLVFFACAAGAVLIPAGNDPVLRNMKLFVAMGIGLWAFAGLYFTFTPDVLKYPHIMPFSMVRNLRWPQTIAYLIVFVVVLRMLCAHTDGRRLALAALALGALFVTGPNNHELWIALTAGCAVIAAAAVFVLRRLDTGVFEAEALWLDAASANRFLLITFGLSILIAFGTTIQKRLPDWTWMMQHGIYGGSEVAKWINVIDYVKAETPKDAMILPLEYYPGGTKDNLRARRHLASRTGRSIPVLRECSSMFHVPGLVLELEQQANMLQFEKAMLARDWTAAYALFGNIQPAPTYLILPEDIANPGFFEVFPFIEQTTIDGFTIYKRADTAEGSPS